MFQHTGSTSVAIFAGGFMVTEVLYCGKRMRGLEKEVEDSDFESEDVSARSKGPFTEVSCGDVYAFERAVTTARSPTVTDEDYSPSDSVKATQYGVEVTYPNGKEKMLVFQPSVCTHYSKSDRERVMEKLFNDGTLWVAEYSNIFSESGFPQMREKMVAPTKESASKILSERDSGITNMSPSDKSDIANMVAPIIPSLAVIGALGIAVYSLNQVLPESLLLGVLGLTGVAIIRSKKNMVQFIDRCIEFIDSVFELDAPYMWMDEVETDISELDPLSESKEQVESYLSSADMRDKRSEKGTIDIEVTEVEETGSHTLLSVIYPDGVQDELVFKTAPDNSDMYTLNRLVSQAGVGSVQNLQFETITLSITTLSSDVKTHPFSVPEN